jgi:hypothetical protein
VSKDGQVMKAMAGKANPQVVNELLKKALDWFRSSPRMDSSESRCPCLVLIEISADLLQRFPDLDRGSARWSK